MVNSPYIKTIARSIKMTLPRFIAIFAIIALGAGFFSGLKVTTPSFVYTGDKYLKEYAMFDFKMLSTIGFTDEDIEEIAKRTSCVVEGAYSADCSAYLGDSFSADTVRFMSITSNVNKVDLKSGRMPEKPDEIVVDAYVFPEMEPGTKLVISDETTDKSLDMFKYREYTIVGTARTTTYLNFQRGTSNEGSGSISYFVLALPGAFDSEYYTEAYLYANTDFYIYSDEYKDWAANAEKQYKVVLRSVINDRFEALIKEEYDKLYDGIDEFNEGIDEGWGEITDARQKLDDAKKELEDAQAEIDKGWTELADGKATLDETSSTLADYKKQLTSTKVLLEASKADLDRKKSELDALQADIDQILSELSEERATLNSDRSATTSRIASLNYSISTYESAIASLDAGIENTKARLENATTEWEKNLAQTQLDNQIAQRENYVQLLEGAKAEIAELTEFSQGFDARQDAINAKQKEYDSKIADYNSKYAVYISDKVTYEYSLHQYESSKSQYDSAYMQYAEGLNKYYEGVSQLNDAQAQVDEGWAEYRDGVRKLWEGYSEYSMTAEYVFNANLVYGYELIESVDDPEVYILGRDKNTGYVCFDNDSQIVDGVAAVFPIFFFAIAALVCSTTMSRMVGDERGIIGTMRALGFTDTAIVMKYAIYAGSAAVLGCILGFLGGTKLFPYVIWEVYRMMYGFADLSFKSSVPLFVIVFIASLACTVGVSVVTSLSALKGMPAELIRPKAPLPGKRILLERMGFIWKRMKFLHKVSARNVFRFKKRMFMMIVGIAGCTSLLITAFGLYDSICNVVAVQYDTITKYDLAVTFDEHYRQYEIEDAAAIACGETGVECDYAVLKNDTAKNNGSGYVRDVDLFISDDANILKIFGVYDYKTGEALPWPADGEVAISQKLADKNKVKVGDTVTLLYGNDEHEVTVKISSIFRNYTYHYVLMTPATYREFFGKPYTPETLLVSTATDTREDAYKVASYLSDNYDLKTWFSTADSKEGFSNTMDRMNYIIVLVVASAAALAFIVLFNLNNINITERIREIATLKVLGFNRNETGAYVTRENVLLVLMGYATGIPLGFLLHRFVMDQIEMDMITYDIHITFLSFIYSLLFVLAFSTIVNLIMRAKIEKIDMAESLKSAE